MRSELDQPLAGTEIEYVMLRGPTPAAQLLFIRHAEALASDSENPLDPGLSQCGERQAAMLAQRLVRESRVERLYASPSRRTRLTAATIGDELDLPVIEVYDLRDVELRRPVAGHPVGSYSGTVEQIGTALRETGRWDALPSAEPSAKLRARVRRAVSTICATNPTRRVAIITHAAVINAYLAEILSSERDILFLPRCASINAVLLQGDTILLDRMNDVRHLQAAD